MDETKANTQDRRCASVQGKKCHFNLQYKELFSISLWNWLKRKYLDVGLFKPSSAVQTEVKEVAELMEVTTALQLQQNSAVGGRMDQICQWFSGLCHEYEQYSTLICW